MIKAVIFDADGVLINAERFSLQLARDYGITTDKTLPFFTGIFKDCLIGKADLKEVVVPYLSDWGWTKSVDELLNYWFSSENKVNEDLMVYIQELRKRGIRCFLATNNEKHRVNFMLINMNFDKDLDKVYASADIGFKKPSPEFFSKMIDDIKGISKDEILFWDDDEENVQGAKDFGIHAEFYSTIEEFKTKMTTYLKDSSQNLVTD